MTEPRYEKMFALQDRDAMVALGCDLVNIPSPTGEELAIGDYAARRFRELGLRVELQEVEPARNNVIARLKGSRPGRTLMFLAHFDTSTDPGAWLPSGFQPTAKVENGWIHGLGITNMKCAFAAYYSALQMIIDAQADFAGEIVVCGVVGEIEKGPIDEWQGRRYRGGGSGARYLVNHGVTADWVINGEPTGLRLQTANCGYLFIRIRIEGEPQSTFSKDKALDPMPKALDLYKAIQDWEPEYQRRHPHPLIKLLVGIGGIYGGMPYKPSITPSFTSLYLHVNMLPGQSILGVKRELEELIAGLHEKDPDLRASVDIFVASNGYEIPWESELPQAVAAAHQDVFGKPVTRPNPERYSVSSDNNPLFEFGIPGVTYGGGGLNLRGEFSSYEPGVGEVVSIDNLASCARVYAVSALRLLNGE